MTDIERIELAIRRVLASCKNTDPIYLLRDLADELARMRGEPEHPPGYKLNWR